MGFFVFFFFQFPWFFYDPVYVGNLKFKKAKWLSEEALQITEKTREVKGKGERERYTQLNAEFQRIARRDKKACLNKNAKK